MRFDRKIIYFLKRSVHKLPWLYKVIYFLITLNFNNLALIWKRKLYPSHFGGMWTDRSDFTTLLENHVSKKKIKPEEVEQLKIWREKGFIIIEKAVSIQLIDQLLDEFNSLPHESPLGLRITGGGELNSRLYKPELIQPHQSIRIVDYYFFSETARSILFSPSIVRFLKIVFENDPVLTQSLSFEYGSEQEIHQDTAFVIMNSPLNFAASWIALEDVTEGSGELVYYPGSHLWGDFLFSKYFKHWDRERDGEEQLNLWYNWMHAEADRLGIKKEYFRPKKGDILLWHGGLAHGGAKIKNSKLTRKSLVGHYCPLGVRPLYHYYKPINRKIYKTKSNFFTSSHYLPAEFRS